MAGEIGTLCICAERYALEGHMHTSSTVCKIIKNNIRVLDIAALYTLIEDIETAADKNEHVGKEWSELLDVLEKELDRRL